MTEPKDTRRRPPEPLEVESEEFTADPAKFLKEVDNRTIHVLRDGKLVLGVLGPPDHYDGGVGPADFPKIESAEDLTDFVFDKLGDPVSRLNCACDECEPFSKHMDTSLAMTNGQIFVGVEEKTYKISITEVETPE